MTERRSIGEALATLPAEARGFIQGNAKPANPTKTSSIKVELASSPGEPSEAVDQERRSSPRRTRTRTSSSPRARVEVPESWKVPITTKLQYGTVQALRRAYLEQKLNHATPDTQQEIVEFAVQDWLKRNGFLRERSEEI